MREYVKLINWAVRYSGAVDQLRQNSSDRQRESGYCDTIFGVQVPSVCLNDFIKTQAHERVVR